MIGIIAGSSGFTISPATPVHVVSSDTAASPSGWDYDITYDGGGTWYPIAAGSTLGSHFYDPTTDLPNVQPSTDCFIRVTNATTLASAMTIQLTALSDNVNVGSAARVDPQTMSVELFYASDGVPVVFTGGSPSTVSTTADTTGGTEAQDTCTNPSANVLELAYADPLSTGATFTLIGTGDLTYDRPAVEVLPGQTLTIPA